MDYKKIIEKIQDIPSLHEAKAQLIGKQGYITQKLKELANFSIELRKTEGKKINDLKNYISKALKEKEKLISKKEAKKIDYTLPLNIQPQGLKHIITESVELLERIFNNLGFKKFNGPDIEKIYYNFDALNMPLEHPARDNNDTFYMNEQELLRTQVTAVQIRLLEKMKNSNEDIRAYSIGQVYRNDDNDATHSCMFSQIEGIIVEKNVTMQHLKGFIEYLLEEFFQKKIKVDFKPSYFPFTEPSCEVFAHTKINNGKLEVCSEGEALEIGGCGIIHPSILKNFNKEGKQAFAFGMGLERWIMLKYGIKNLQTLYNNHMNKLRYYKENL